MLWESTGQVRRACLSPTVCKDAPGLGSCGTMERVGRDVSRECRAELGLCGPLFPPQEGLSLVERNHFSPEVCRTVCQLRIVCFLVPHESLGIRLLLDDLKLWGFQGSLKMTFT